MKAFIWKTQPNTFSHQIAGEVGCYVYICLHLPCFCFDIKNLTLFKQKLLLEIKGKEETCGKEIYTTQMADTFILMKPPNGNPKWTFEKIGKISITDIRKGFRI